VVEGHLGDGAVGIDVPLEVGLCHILEGIFVGFLFQQIGLGGNFEHMVGLLSNDVFVYECIQSYRLYTKLSIVRLAENICPREKNIGQSDMDFLVDRKKFDPPVKENTGGPFGREGGENGIGGN
jgi:hypothetical protein